MAPASLAVPSSTAAPFVAAGDRTSEYMGSNLVSFWIQDLGIHRLDGV